MNMNKIERQAKRPIMLSVVGRQYWESYEGWLRRRIAQHLWAAAGYRKGGPRSRWVRRWIREELECCRELRIALKQWRLPG